MPASIINEHNPREARLWASAKTQAKAAGKGEDYAYITGTFERMRDRVGGGKTLKDQAVEAMAGRKKKR